MPLPSAALWLRAVQPRCGWSTAKPLNHACPAEPAERIDESVRLRRANHSLERLRRSARSIDHSSAQQARTYRQSTAAASGAAGRTPTLHSWLSRGLSRGLATERNAVSLSQRHSRFSPRRSRQHSLFRVHCYGATDLPRVCSSTLQPCDRCTATLGTKECSPVTALCSQRPLRSVLAAQP